MAKKKKKNLFKRLWEDVKRAGQGIGKGLHKVGNAYIDISTFVVLAPFKKAMKKALDRKGIKYKNRLTDIAPKFVKHVVKDQKNYETYQGDLKHFEEYEALENLEFLDGYELYWANGEVANLTDELAEEGAKVGTQVASSIIKAIVDFFKNLLKKKQSGQPMTDAENKMAELAEKGAAISDQVIREEMASRTGEFVLDNKTLLMIAGAVIIIYFVARKR